MSLENIIIQRAKNGNQLAFKWLYEKNVDSIFNFMSQFSKNSDEIKDWVQRGFIKSFTKLDQFDNKAQFKTWLYSITINEMKMDKRKFSSQFETENIDDEQNHKNEEIKIEWKIDLKKYIDELSELPKSVFILYEVEGFSHTEIARMLNISTALSRTTLSRTKQLLREKLSEL